MCFNKCFGSRLFTQVPCCKHLPCHQVGRHILVGMVRADKRCSGQYMHGKAQLHDQVLRYADVCGLSSLPLRSGYRAALHLDVFQCAVHGARQRLDVLLMLSGQRFATAVPGTIASGFRSDVLYAAYTQAGVIGVKVFTVARSLPWCVVRGDNEANIEAMRGVELSHDGTTDKIKVRWVLGHSNVLLALDVQRIGDVVWTTPVSEQGHASAALPHRRHTLFGVQL